MRSDIDPGSLRRLLLDLGLCGLFSLLVLATGGLAFLAAGWLSGDGLRLEQDTCVVVRGDSSAALEFFLARVGPDEDAAVLSADETPACHGMVDGGSTQLTAFRRSSPLAFARSPQGDPAAGRHAPRISELNFSIEQVEIRGRIQVSSGALTLIGLSTLLGVLVAGLSFRSAISRLGGTEGFDTGPAASRRGSWLLLACVLWGVVAFTITQNSELRSPQSELLSATAERSVFLLLVFACLLMPAVEEWAFRGVLLARFRRGAARLIGAVWISMLFAALHGFTPVHAPKPWLMLCLASLLFSAATALGGSWRWGFAGHALYNLAVISLALWIGQTGGA